MPYEVSGLVDIVRNPTYSTGVGLLLYGMKQAQEREGLQPVKDPGINMLDKVKKFLFRDD
jgi:cell division protein FtsA